MIDYSKLADHMYRDDETAFWKEQCKRLMQGLTFARTMYYGNNTCSACSNKIDHKK